MRWPRCKTRSTRKTLWDLDSQVECGVGSAALPARQRRCRNPFRWRAPLAWRCAKLLLEAPDMLLLDEPTNHLDAENGRVAATAPDRLQRHDPDRHPRPLLPWMTSPVGFWNWIADAVFPMRGNYSAWLEQKAKRLAQDSARGQIAPEIAGARIGMDPGRGKKGRRQNQIQRPHFRI